MTAHARASSVWVVVLAGGVGRRFWPLSTRRRPKQLLPLAGSDPLIAQTVARVGDLVPTDRLRILTGTALRDPIQSATKLPDGCFLVEPRARGTGPPLAWAAHEAARRDPDAVIVSLHADHVIHPARRFRDVLRAAAGIAVRDQLLMTVAVPPDRPETGFGYLRPGPALAAPAGHRAYRVAAFVEKPDAERATRYVAAGYRWNCGIFAWPARLFLDQVRAHAPEISRALPLLEADDAAGFFDRADSISVDEAVLERSARVGAVDATFAWDDMGSWEAVARHGSADEAGNVAKGDVAMVDGRSNLVIADSGRVVLLGARDLLVVRTGGTTLVMPRSESHRLKDYLERVAVDDDEKTGRR